MEQFLAGLAGFRPTPEENPRGIDPRAADMIHWLALADHANPGVRAKVGRMHREMVGRDNGKQAEVAAALDAVDYRFTVALPGFTPWGPLLEYVAQCDREGNAPEQAGVRYVNALHRVGLDECRSRVTNELAVTLARAMAKGRGRKRGRSPTDKHEGNRLSAKHSAGRRREQKHR